MIGGNHSESIAKKIATNLKANFIETEFKKFPDGEGKLTLKKIPKKNSKIIIVHSCHPPVDSNFLQLFHLISKSKEFSNKITIIVPYFGYARQDREFLSGEIVSMKTLGKLLKLLGVSKTIVFDIHSNIALKHFKTPSENLTAVPLLANYFLNLKLKKPLIISPDEGGRNRAEKFAKIMKLECLVLKKKRDRKTGQVKISDSKLSQVKDRDVILVDDMISTGGSIIKATEFLKKQKCRRIFVACTHGLLVDNADKKIRKAGVTEIVSTNTIPGSTNKVDISSLITEKHI